VTIHEAAFDGLGRRVVKTVSDSGDLDGVTEYYHNSNQIIETRDASANLETQVSHGAIIHAFLSLAANLRNRDGLGVECIKGLGIECINGPRIFMASKCGSANNTTRVICSNFCSKKLSSNTICRRLHDVDSQFEYRHNQSA
jgi:hypothetical protein